MQPVELTHQAVRAREASRLITASTTAVVARALELQWSHWPGLKDRLTEVQLAHTERDTAFHLTYLASALFVGQPALFADYICWSVRLFTAKSIPLEWIPESIELINVAIGEVCGTDTRTVAETYTVPYMNLTLGDCPRGGQSEIDPTAPLGTIAIRYLSALLAQNRPEAIRIIMHTIDHNVSIQDLYVQVLQPALREVGRLWQSNQISVAQEHYATSVTQMAMSQLYGPIFDTAKTGRRMVAACAAGELHEVGMRMVADLFELDGWETYYIGANAPVGAVVDAVADFRADVLALSATMAFHLRDIIEMIQAIRADERTKDTVILVGGYPFNIAPDLWHELGADGYGSDAKTAIAEACRLTDVHGIRG